MLIYRYDWIRNEHTYIYIYTVYIYICIQYDVTSITQVCICIFLWIYFERKRDGQHLGFAAGAGYFHHSGPCSAHLRPLDDCFYGLGNQGL